LDAASTLACGNPLMLASCRVPYCRDAAIETHGTCQLRCYEDAGEDASEAADDARGRQRAGAIGKQCIARASSSASLAGQECSDAEVAACTTDGCDGYSLDGVSCWFESPAGESCAAECEVHGGHIDPVTYHSVSFIGRQWYPGYDGVAAAPQPVGPEMVDHVSLSLYPAAVSGLPGALSPGYALLCACTDIAP
jgi:hypothetical protein